MKTKNILLVASVLMLAACSDDFLNRVPQDALVDASFYQNDEQVLSGTALLYSNAWKGYIDKSNYTLGDFLGGTTYCRYCNRDIVEFKVTEVSDRSEEGYQGFYNVIAQANLVISNVNNYAGEAVSDAIKRHALAEARFMRATAYAYLVMNYGAVPIIENNMNHLGRPDLRKNTEQSVWEFVLRDYEYAAENLPEESIQPGRLTKWSAEGMLARTHLTIAGFGAEGSGARDQEHLDKAKEYAERVITMSGKSLLDNYEDLFKYPYDNNQESLFELQWVYSSAENGYDVGNSMISQISPYAALGANGEGWGGDQGATLWMLSLYDGLFVADGATPGFTLDQRLKATYLMPGVTYSYMLGEVINDDGTKANEPFTVPRDGEDGSVVARIKKYIPGKIDGVTLQQRYPNNTYMLRLAEMYLIYAEAELGNNPSTNDPKALQYFNAVHMRAGLPEFTDPLMWEDIFEERIKEFAMEGMAWYDIIRLKYFNEGKAMEIINGQYRGLYTIVPNQWPNPTGWSFEKEDSDFDYAVVESNASFRLPFPASELSQVPSLSLEPVPYEFPE